LHQSGVPGANVVRAETFAPWRPERLQAGASNIRIAPRMRASMAAESDVALRGASAMAV